MASFHRNQFQQFLQQPSSQTQQSKPFFGDLYDSSNNSFKSLDHQPSYIPPFQVAGLAPGLVQEENELNLQWGFDPELKRERPKEQVFLENNYNNNNSQMSSCLEFFPARSVSTGLELSLENPRLASSDDLALLGLVGHDFHSELRRQDAEIDRYVKLQGDRLRQAIMKKFQSNQHQTISYVEEKVLQKLREKDAELEKINKKNIELELQLEQLALEANAWQQRAKYNENMINTSKLNLQQIYAQNRDSKEGCGDSEINDTASCCYGRTDKKTEGSMICKVCGVNEVCMLLLPCKHLCSCKECESKLSVCPLCHSSKYIGMEVYR